MEAAASNNTNNNSKTNSSLPIGLMNDGEEKEEIEQAVTVVASAMVVPAAAAAAAPIVVVDLCDDDDDDEDDPTTGSTTTCTTIITRRYASVPDIIDLCGGSSEDITATTAAAANDDFASKKPAAAANDDFTSKKPAAAAAAAAATAMPATSATTLGGKLKQVLTSSVSTLYTRFSPTGTNTKTNTNTNTTPSGNEDDLTSMLPASSSSSPAETYRCVLGPLRMEFIETFVFHTFATQPCALQRVSARPLYQELLEYKLNLPIELSSSIFVRVLEARFDLVRAVITGPDQTPYANGCFVFDIHLNDYPAKPPKVQFLTVGGGGSSNGGGRPHPKVRFNPNLYACGKVCLSLLGTWQGPNWIPHQSTLLQVLVSIQGLILVPEPYYNEPGYGQPNKHKQAVPSKVYNTNIRRMTLQHAMNTHLLQLLAALQTKKKKKQIMEPTTKKRHDHYYPEFDDVMMNHFCQRSDAIFQQMDEWVKDDKGLAPLVKQVRTNLQLLLAEQQQLRQPQQPQPQPQPQQHYDLTTTTTATTNDGTTTTAVSNTAAQYAIDNPSSSSSAAVATTTSSTSPSSSSSSSAKAVSKGKRKNEVISLC